MKIESIIKSDNNIKIGFSSPEGFIVEAVYLANIECVCISSQIGCATKCIFCASGNKGFYRNLSTDEMMEQYQYFELNGYNVKTVHIGGIGEPLRNIENIVKLKRNIGDRLNVEITTSMPNKKSFYRILNEGFKAINISLHSMRKATRRSLMPNSLPLEEIINTIETVLYRFPHLRDVVNISYLLLGDINTSDEEQKDFINYCKKLDVKLLLMKYNVVDGNLIYESNDETYERLVMKCILAEIKYMDSGSSSTRRDLNGGCGTLYLKH